MFELTVYKVFYFTESTCRGSSRHHLVPLNSMEAKLSKKAGVRDDW